jgi:hypothetical protein
MWHHGNSIPGYEVIPNAFAVQCPETAAKRDTLVIAWDWSPVVHQILSHPKLATRHDGSPRD